MSKTLFESYNNGDYSSEYDALMREHRHEAGGSTPTAPPYNLQSSNVDSAKKDVFLRSLEAFEGNLDSKHYQSLVKKTNTTLESTSHSQDIFRVGVKITKSEGYIAYSAAKITLTGKSIFESSGRKEVEESTVESRFYENNFKVIIS